MIMVNKNELHLGQAVLVGTEMKKAVIDALTQTFAGVVLQGGGYGFYEYNEICLSHQ